MKRVATIIVTYNRLPLLKEEICSIRKQSYQDFDIIVVNNGSTDETLEWLNEQPDIIIINQDNQGCSGGMYTGIKYAVERGYDLCWVMDDDVEYKEDSLFELVKAYDSVSENVGFVCSRVEGVNGQPMNVPPVDHRPSPNGYPYYYEHAEKGLIKVIRGTFVSLLFSSSLIKNVGLPIKEFFIWGDDTEFTLRLSKNKTGYLCLNSIAIHKRTIQGDLSFETESNPQRLNNYFYMFRNQGFTVKSHSGKKAFAIWYIKTIIQGVSYLLKLNFDKSNVIFKALLRIPFFNPKVKYPLC